MGWLSHPAVRRVVKDAAATAIHYSGLRNGLAAYRRACAGGRRILILSYHRVVDDFAGELRRSIPGLLTSRQTFRRHLEEAHRQGYRLSSLEDALEVLSGRRREGRDLCVVTFDDGYRDVYRHAFPVLRAMGVPAIVYLPAALVGTDRRFNHDRLFHLVGWMRERGLRPRYDGLPACAPELLEPVLGRGWALAPALDDFIGRHRTAELSELIEALARQLGGGPELTPAHGDVMDWDEVRRMAGAGIAFGAHTLDHCVLTVEDEAAVEREVRGSRERIERELGGARVRDFAYCNGWYSDRVIRVLIRCGFRSAVTTEDLPNRVGGDPFALKRKVLWENFSLGVGGGYSRPLTACHLDGVFGALGVTRPVLGRRA
jgi:peptidoglycan/xylan/chitin deacetylase (PgdA/CDA1 family)